MLKIDKKQVKIISLAIAVIFMLGVVGLALSQSGKTYAADSNDSNVGVVNKQMILAQHPDVAKAEETMKAEVEQARKEFEEKSAGMKDEEKQAYYMQVQQRLTAKKQELLNPIMEKVDAAIKATAEARGLAVVVDKNNVVYGGRDITEDVLKKIGAK